MSELILCKCGCGQTRERFDNRNRERFYIYGHCVSQILNYNIGKPNSPEQKLKISIANKGENNGMWRGVNAKLPAIHKWVALRKPKPKLCDNCKQDKPYDLANISGKYKRDINDFDWLCRRCHMLSDNRMNNLKQFQYKKGHNQYG